MENPLLSEDSIVIASLLDGMLYAINDVKPPAELSAVDLDKSSAFSYLGENNKYILFLLSYENQKEVLPAQDLDLISKTLQALKLELRDVAIVNRNNSSSYQLEEYINYFSPNKIVLFGLTIKQLGEQEDFEQNKIFQFKDRSILQTSSLAALQLNKDLKMAWWTAMKTLLLA